MSKAQVIADQERRRSNAAVPWSRKTKKRDNRAAAKAALRKEYR